MTLVELLIVLAILGMLTGLLVSSADGLMDRARVEETERRGQAVVRALTSDGDRISRFIADMGRPPILVSPDKGKQLCELWAPAAEADGYAYHDADVEVVWPSGDTGMSPTTSFTLWCGWRGPYIQIGGDVFYDGWPEGGWSLLLEGESDFVDPDPETGGFDPSLLDNRLILRIRSLGANGTVDEGESDWCDVDRYFPSHGRFLPGTADLTVMLYAEDGELIEEGDFDRLRALLIVPDATSTACNAGYILIRWTEDPDPDKTVVDASSTTVIGNAVRLSIAQVRFTGLMPGPRLLYAYGFEDSDHDTARDGGEALTVILRPGSNETELYLKREI
jgi:type II secretory pathway pseudopilin PulG